MELRRGEIMGAVALGLAGALGLAAWGVLAGARTLARRAVEVGAASEEPIELVEVGTVEGHAAVIIRGVGAASPGKYSLLLRNETQRCRIGRVIQVRGDLVARELLATDVGPIQAGARGRIAGWWFARPEELGYRVERITYSTELGPADAWVIHPRIPRKRRWAVHVHGRGADPLEVLRGVGPLARAGITSMVISYRNDPGAPSGLNGRYGMGLAEANDVDAAISEVRSRGAERVTIVGWSMGGTAALVAATRGQHRDVIDGLILESPAVDWPDVLRLHARAAGAPTSLTRIGLGMLRSGCIRGGVDGGLDLESLVPERFAADLRVPVLIQASTGDTFVPSDGAERLAALAPRLVELRLVTDAEHVRLWNVDPVGWEEAAHRFAKTLPRPAWRG